MRNFSTVLLATALLGGCVQAQSPSAVPAMAPVMASAPRMAAISDSEPDVTAQVSNLLAQAGASALPREQLSSNAQNALDAPATAQMAAALRPCGTAPALELLSRTTKGEDRNYLYRAPCNGKPLLVEITFGKGARVNHLLVRQER
ncbi:MAG: hypothetical protein ACJ8GW_18980 [Massilia sp.]